MESSFECGFIENTKQGVKIYFLRKDWGSPPIELITPIKTDLENAKNRKKEKVCSASQLEATVNILIYF